MNDAYNTNLAAEFYVLSMLHRKGANANLTLGNKKSVDVAVIHDAGDSITIDVKGLAGTTGWPLDNFTKEKDGHFLVFVSFKGKVSDHKESPEVYVIPSTKIKPLMYNAPGGRKLITLAKLHKEGGDYRDAWQQLL